MLPLMSIVFVAFIKCNINYAGGTQELEKQKVPLFGDQLTRIRMHYAKPIRVHAPTREKRLEDIGPVMCTMWHIKQDLLEVCEVFL